jgi:disulfide bond formation protein DsbB
VSDLRWPIVIVAFAGALSAGAQFMEHVLGLEPCPLCLMQRVWVMLAGAIACVALADRPARPVYPLMTATAAVAGLAFALRQLFLQNLPPEEVPACGPDLGYMFEAFPFVEVLKAMTVGTGNCAEPDYVLGVNLALWSLLGFLGLIAASVLWWRHDRTTQTASG